MSGSLRRDVTLCVCVDVCTLGCGLDHAHLACSTLQRGPEHVLNCYDGFDCSANPQVISTFKCFRLFLAGVIRTLSTMFGENIGLGLSLALARYCNSQAMISIIVVP